MGREKIVGTIKVGEEPFFEVVDKGDATLEIRFVYEPERALRLPKKLVTSLTQILKAYDGRRRHPRYSFSEEVLIEAGESRIRIVGRTANLSESGTFVETLAGLPHGSEVLIKIPPKKTLVHARALVRGVRSGVGMGLEFTNVAPRSRSKLAELLKGCGQHSVT